MWVPTSTGPATGAYTTNVYGPNNRVGNVPYDAAGNLLIANGNMLSYDAESRQAAATEPRMYGGGQEQYLYDGNGQRVVKERIDFDFAVGRWNAHSLQDTPRVRWVSNLCKNDFSKRGFLDSSDGSRCRWESGAL